MGLASAILWIYIAVRAGSVAFTTDEAISYDLLHGATSVSATANDQWLNTLLMGVGEDLFGSSPWALRLANVLAFPVYAGSCLILVRRLRHDAARVICFVALLGDPFLLEFFGLARGYGLSLAFSAAALAALLSGPRADSMRRLYARLGVVAALGALAFYSNFSALNVVLALIVTVLADAAIKVASGRLPARRRDLVATGVIVIVIGLVITPGVSKLSQLQNTAQLYYGGHTGFVQDTIGTLVQTWGYVYSFAVPLRPWAHPIAWLVTGVAALAVVGAVREVVRQRRWSGWQMLSLVAVIVVVAVVLEHLILGSLYPLDRAALFYVLSFGILIASAIDWSLGRMTRSAGRTAVVAGCGALSVLGVVNVIRCANSTRALTWSFDASASDAVHRVMALEGTSRTPSFPVKLVTTFTRGYALAYYQQSLGLKWLEVVQPLAPGASPPPGGDVYDVATSYAAQAPRGLIEVARFPQDGTELRATTGFVAQTSPVR